MSEELQRILRSSSATLPAPAYTPNLVPLYTYYESKYHVRSVREGQGERESARGSAVGGTPSRASFWSPVLKLLGSPSGGGTGRRAEAGEEVPKDYLAPFCSYILPSLRIVGRAEHSPLQLNAPSAAQGDVPHDVQEAIGLVKV